MRAAARLFASVKEGKFLESGAPTGLTGLLTHPSPRSTLVYLYCSTLDKLKEIPESSVYRQATQALTQHRLQIIEAAKPAGYRAWQERIQYLVDENPRAFEVVETSMGSRIRVKSTRKFVDFRLKKSEWDGEKAPRFAEGPRTATQRASVHPIYGGGKDYQAHDDLKEVTLDPEPQLTAEQYVLKQW
jgi:NADH dehydrogenase (ubiquinone) 1 alpha subcomplex subunit 5